MADYSYGGEGLLEGIQAITGLEHLREARESFPSILAGQQLDVQQKKVNLDVSNLELQRQRMQLGAVQQAIAQGKLGGENSLSDQLNTQAQIELDSDNPAEANNLARTASEITRNRSTIETAQYNQAVRTANILGSLLEQSGVHDQLSYETFLRNAQIQAGLLGAPQVIGAIQKLPKVYNPQTIENLRSGWQTVLQTAQTKATEARQRASEAEVKHYDFLDNLSASEAEYYKDRAASLQKAGATQLIPKESDVKVITDLLGEEYGNPADLQQTQRFANRARPVAERMLELLRQNPGMKQSQAARQAFQEAKESGWFGGLKANRPRLGMSAEAPAPLPSTKAEAKDNTWYNVNGKSMLLMNRKLYSQQEISQMEQQDDLDEQDQDEDEDDEDADQP